MPRNVCSECSLRPVAPAAAYPEYAKAGMCERCGADEEISCRELREATLAAEAEVADVLEFLKVEMHWEYFREEMLYGGPEDLEKKNASADNARLIANRLKNSGRGIAFLKRARAMAKALTDVANCHHCPVCARKAEEALRP